MLTISKHFILSMLDGDIIKKSVLICLKTFEHFCSSLIFNPVLNITFGWCTSKASWGEKKGENISKKERKEYA